MARGRALTAAALAAALGTGGCGRPPAAREAVRFWALGREGEVVKDLVPGFEKRHPGVSVEVQQIPFTAAHEKLLTAFVGRETPDVAQLGNTWIPEFTALGALERLDARVAASRALAPGDFEVVAFHPLGTCRIGVSPERGVVDPSHESFDTPGLYVTDGSAIPSSLGVNPQLTIMALALRAAEIIDARLDKAAALRDHS